MIVLSYSNIDIIQGVIGYGNAVEGITDWRITNTSNGIFNILNSSSIIRPSGGTTEIGEIPGSTDRYMIFTAGTSTFTVPSGGIKCDILIVGGGGGGGGQNAGGGGAGGLVLIQNITLSGNFTINVGNGGSGGSGEGAGGPGINTTFTKSDNSLIITANGGGSGGGRYNIGGNGGSGGGGGFIYSNGTQTQKSQSQTGIMFPATINQFGEDGGHGGGGTSSYPGGGGGGAGGVGATSGANETGQNGGLGIDRVGNFIFKEKFISSVGDNGWFAGGGGSAGGYQNTNYAYGNGGSTLFGGGGNGDGVGRGINGINGTGGGGGGARLGAGGGSGGSGIVIIRYSTANISIIDNGNVGFGITPTTNSSKLEIAGDINISGNYKINNVDIINSSSNYILSTSNLLIPRISTDIRDTSNYVSSINTTLNTRINDTSNYMRTTSNILANSISGQWTSTSSGIYYNTPITTPITLPNEIGVEKYMVFTYTGDTIAGSGQTRYTINIPTGGILCDILMVGGGGAGGAFIGPGGGGGAVLYGTNINIPSGTYTINVGRGGTSTDTKGFSTEGFGALLLGGGSAQSSFYSPALSNSGGSGSGGQSTGSSFNSGGSVGISSKGTILSTAILYNGNIGGSGVVQGPPPQQAVSSGGGGGAGTAGQVGTTDNTRRSAGGDGILVNITGTNYYWGAGGGGGAYCTSAGNGGLGGGGMGIVWSADYGGTSGIVGGSAYSYAANTINAGNGTGSGGGGGGDGGTGGSGIIIIKYYSIQQTIQKSIISLPVITPTIITGITTGTVGTTDSYMVFTYTSDTVANSGQTQYTINIPTGGVICDILIVGGGGQGGCTDGGGGGSGGLVFIQNKSFASGTYTINVGSGGIDVGVFAVSRAGSNGKDTTINFGGNTFLIAKGGGGGGSGFSPEYAGISGGSGGGAGSVVDDTTGKKIGAISIQSIQTEESGIYGYGNKGGNNDGTNGGGGGGGASSLGANNGLDSTQGIGGNGLASIGSINFKTFFGLPTSGIGEYISAEDKIYFAGGGGGGHHYNSSTATAIDKTGGKGGGGQGRGNNNGVAGISTTGGGGGGGGGGHGRGGNGGSGIVIIRYRKNTITAYVGIGTTNPISELHLYDDTKNNTKLTIQNNYTDPVVITPNTGYTSVETIESNINYRTLTFTYSPNYPENPANTTLLAWYKFDGDGLDYSPWTTKYNLIANVGTPTYSSGTATDSFLQGRRYINTSTGSLRNTSLSLSSRAFSVAVWQRRKNSGRAFFVAQGTAGANTTVIIGPEDNNTYFLGFHNNDLVTSAYPNDLNTWIHMVYVVLPNYNRRIYRNGVLIAIDANGSAVNCVGDLRIGGNYYDNTNVNIELSDLRIYTNGLSSTEVEQLYYSYTNSLITDNYGINFPNTLGLTVNGTSKTVKGQYNISTGHINSSMLPLEAQSDIPLASTATTTVTIKYPYNTKLPILPNEIGIDQYMVFTYTSDTVANSGQTQYTINIPTGGIICDILIVGGGGGGGNAIHNSSHEPGGGGAGGVVYMVNKSLSDGTYKINVGNGGAGNTNGNNSTITDNNNNTLTFDNILLVGKGGGKGATGNQTVGSDGGSGGGGGHDRANGGTATQGNTFWNGTTYIAGGNNGARPGGGSSGGGGGGAGEAGDADGGGCGGDGVQVSISGTNTFYAGGGNAFYNTSTIRSDGGGGTLNGTGSQQNGGSALPNTGSGGSGAYTTSSSTTGGSGGSGIVIIKCTKTQHAINSTPSVISQTVTRGIIGTTDRTISFTYTSDSAGLTGQTLYTFTPVQNIICDILVVGAGGGGGRFGGGGGGGAVLLGVNFKLNAGSTVSIKVGNGGTGATTVNNGVNGINGYDSSITINSIEYIANGGGGGGTRNSSPYIGKNGNTGGSGGGGSTGDSGQGLGGVSNKNNYANFQSFGNNGGNGKPNSSGVIGWASGGGGGAGSNGSDFTLTNGGGNGGLGKEFIALFGASVGHNGYFAGGGGGNTYHNVGNRGYGNGGLGLYGGGGNGSFDGTIAYFADNGLPNTGGGGGGGNHNTYTNHSSSGGNGGSGFVIIRYRINTIQTSSVELIRNTAPPNEILVPGATSTTIGQFDRLISFPYTSDSTGLVGQTQYTFTTTENLICDILVIGGGGGGGMNSGGGGGAGGLILLQNINLFGTYTIKIGRGGNGGTQIATNTVAENGINTSFETYIAIGGGAGVNSGGSNGNPGGSGGGAANDMTGNRVGGAGTTGQGNKGGDGTIPGGSDRTGGGGGGAGEAGQTSVSTSQGGKGGIGRDMSLYFGTIFGVNGWFAGGGGGGGGQGTGGIGGTGGGGNGGINNQEGINGTGGGGGGAHANQSTLGKKGGSGIVIIRYRRNTGYKIGNYNGDFKIISSSTAGDTDYMRITADGASIYNPTGSPLWSTVSDRRIKENIEKASYDKCYDNINKLELYRFNYIKELNNINKDNKQLGYIAQEVEDIFPKAVSSQVFYNNSLSISDLLSIDISQINYSLYGAIKKLIEIYNNVDKRIDALEKILNIEEELVIDISTTTTNNISFYTPPETNIVVDTLTTSNIIGILSVSTMSIYTSNNIIYDISTSNNIDFYTPSTYNYSIDTIKVNNIIDTLITSNLILNIPETLSTSNIVI